MKHEPLVAFFLLFFPQSVLFYVSLSEGMSGTLPSILILELSVSTTYSARAAEAFLSAGFICLLRQ